MEVDSNNHCTISPQHAFSSSFQQGKCCIVDVVKYEGDEGSSINFLLYIKLLHTLWNKIQKAKSRKMISN